MLNAVIFFFALIFTWSYIYYTMQNIFNDYQFRTSDVTIRMMAAILWSVLYYLTHKN